MAILAFLLLVTATILIVVGTLVLIIGALLALVAALLAIVGALLVLMGMAMLLAGALLLIRKALRQRHACDEEREATRRNSPPSSKRALRPSAIVGVKSPVPEGKLAQDRIQYRQQPRFH